MRWVLPVIAGQPAVTFIVVVQFWFRIGDSYLIYLEVEEGEEEWERNGKWNERWERKEYNI